MPDYSPLLEQRALALATVLLTRNPDVRVRDESSLDLGLDLICDILRDKKPCGMQFAVEVMARPSISQLGGKKDGELRLSSDLQKTFAKHQERSHFLPMPLLALLFEMEHDAGYYLWLKKPTLAGLTSPKPTSAVAWGLSTHTDLIEGVQDWYESRSAAVHLDEED